MSRLAWLSLVISCFSPRTSNAAAQSSNPEQLFQEAVAAQQRGDDALAVRDYRALLRSHPDAEIVRVNLGATLAEMKKFDEAIAQYRIVLASHPNNRMARLNLALAYQSSGNLSGAIKEVEHVHRTDAQQKLAEDPQATLLLADCYAQAGRFADVIPLLTPLEAAQPDNADLEWLLGSAMIHAGRESEGVTRVEAAAAKTADANDYLLAGQTRFNMSQFDQARQDADAAKRINASLPGLQTLTGQILEQTSDYPGAEAALQQAVNTDDADYDAHLYLGAVFYFERDMEHAKHHLQRALQLQPASAQARYELALVARAEGQLDAALQYLEQVVRTAPDWMQPHVELSAVYYRMHRPDDGAKQKQIVDTMMASQQQRKTPVAP